MKIKVSILTLGLLALSAAPSAAQWTGCGLGVGGAVFAGALTGSSPIGASVQGEKVSGQFNCDYKVQAFVLGAGVNYDWFAGDAKDLGVKNDLYTYGRLGVLISPAALLYAHAGWTQLDTGGLAGKINGWKFGIGDEFRIPNSPIYLDLRYSYSMYDVKDLVGPSLDANAHEFRVGLNLKLGPGMFGGNGPVFVDDAHTIAPCDKKMANCK